MDLDDFELVHKISDVFLKAGVLKIGSIEGLADLFPKIWALIEPRVKRRDENFKDWCIWWGSMIHAEHEQFYKKPFSECPHTVCASISQTIEEFRHGAINKPILGEDLTKFG